MIKSNEKKAGVISGDRGIMVRTIIRDEFKDDVKSIAANRSWMAVRTPILKRLVYCAMDSYEEGMLFGVFPNIFDFDYETGVLYIIWAYDEYTEHERCKVWNIKDYVLPYISNEVIDCGGWDDGTIEYIDQIIKAYETGEQYSDNNTIGLLNQAYRNERRKAMDDLDAYLKEMW